MYLYATCSAVRVPVRIPVFQSYVRVLLLSRDSSRDASSHVIDTSSATRSVVGTYSSLEHLTTTWYVPVLIVPGTVTCQSVLMYDSRAKKKLQHDTRVLSDWLLATVHVKYPHADSNMFT